MTMNNHFDHKYVIETRNLDIYYGNFKAVTEVNMQIERNAITAIIGPSGCGKSTLLRAFNRMNELYAGTSISGEVTFDGQDIYARDVDAVEVRYRIGMVFQKPNPFPKSIYENIAWTARIHGYKGNMDELVEGTLKQAALWDEVKDKLNQSGLSLSGGQQQRVAIARALIHNPAVVLADEPTASLDTERAFQVVETFAKLVHENNRAGIMVTHDLRMCQYVDRVLQMQDGKLVQIYDTKKDIMELAMGTMKH